MVLELPDWETREFQVKLPAFDVKSGWTLAAESAEKIRVRWTPMRAGELTLPALPIVPVGEGMSEVAKTESARFTVTSTIDPKDAEAQKPAPLIGAMQVAPPWGWIVLISVVLGAVLVALAMWAWKRWRSRKPRIALPPQENLSEDEWAIRSFNQLQARALWEQGKLKAHYFSLSEILKEYIQRRFNFDATERTSSEIVEFLESLGMPTIEAAAVDRLESQFEILDRVKFTDFIPSAEEPARVVEDAIHWVRLTRRPIVVSPSGPKRGGS